MPKQTPALVNFNRGVISKKALARTDLERVASSAEIQENWLPDELGPMMFRPGTEYVGEAANNMVEAIYVPFVYANDDTAKVELTGAEGAAKMRVRVNDELISSPVVTSAVNTPEMGTIGGSWVDDSDPGTTAAVYVYGVGSPTVIALTGTRDAKARIYQSVNTANPNVEHRINIVLDKNWAGCTFCVGSAAQAQNYLEKIELKPGVHSITFTPTASPYFLTFERQGYGRCLIDYVQITAGGVMELDLSRLRLDFSMDPESFRYCQSGDVVFCTNVGAYDRDDVVLTGAGLSYDSIGPLDKLILFAIERRKNNSWSVVRYSPDDGPFGLINVTGVTMTASTTGGDIVTITASQTFFKAGHLNSLIRIDSVGQQVTASLTAADTYTNPVRVTGVGNSRKITYTLTGTWSGTLTLERSVGVIGNWEEVDDTTVNLSESYDDDLDNAVIYYRIGFRAGEYTSGTANITLSYATGSIQGTARIFSVDASGLSVGAMVIEPMGNVNASESWYISQWSYEKGFPSANDLFDSRLWWCGEDRVWGSVIDNYLSHDYEVEGDIGPINRSIGYGPVERLRWMKSAQRLYLGGQNLEHVIKSSSFDEPVTPTDFSIRSTGTAGSCNADAVRVDNGVLFAQRGGRRLYELTINDNGVESDERDLTLLCPELLTGRIKQIAVVRTPVTRAYCVLHDGTIATMVYNRVEEVLGWVPLRLAPRLKAASVFSLPSDDELDVLYYQVYVDDPGAADDGRYSLVRVAREDECIGGTITKLMDHFVTATGSGLSSVGAGHIPNGTTVAIWADGAARDNGVVTAGVVAIDPPADNVVVGLPYQARYKSVKLAYAATPGSTPLLQRKMVSDIGLILINTHSSGIKYGPDFDTLDDLPQVDTTQENSTPPEIYEDFDQDSFTFNGEWNTDSRFCLVAESPKPATVVCAVFTLETSPKG